MTRQEQVGDLDFAWMREYGGAWRVNGCLGVRLHAFYHLSEALTAFTETGPAIDDRGSQSTLFAFSKLTMRIS